ncbi:hypothetical protein BD413DRAFT_575021 [Trametes elegans]|nr:hypothetical protein BD413DRAFT_575021 [Trametes elegans]
MHTIRSPHAHDRPSGAWRPRARDVAHTWLPDCDKAGLFYRVACRCTGHGVFDIRASRLFHLYVRVPYLFRPSPCHLLSVRMRQVDFPVARQAEFATRLSASSTMLVILHFMPSSITVPTPPNARPISRPPASRCAMPKAIAWSGRRSCWPSLQPDGRAVLPVSRANQGASCHDGTFCDPSAGSSPVAIPSELLPQH